MRRLRRRCWPRAEQLMTAARSGDGENADLIAYFDTLEKTCEP